MIYQGTTLTKPKLLAVLELAGVLYGTGNGIWDVMRININNVSNNKNPCI